MQLPVESEVNVSIPSNASVLMDDRKKLLHLLFYLADVNFSPSSARTHDWLLVHGSLRSDQLCYLERKFACDLLFLFSP